MTDRLDEIRKRLQVSKCVGKQPANFTLITGALKSCIHDHGDINPSRIGSAAKRIFGALKPIWGLYDDIQYLLDVIEHYEWGSDLEPNPCTVCGSNTRYGSRHTTCGRAVMKLEKQIAELQAENKELKTRQHTLPIYVEPQYWLYKAKEAQE